MFKWFWTIFSLGAPDITVTPAQNGVVFTLWVPDMWLSIYLLHFAPSDAILKYELSTENKAVDCQERTKVVCTQGAGAHCCARVQGRDLVLGHLHRARILAWVLKKGVCTLAPNEYRTRAPYPGTKCELCLRYQFSSSLILLQYSDEKYDYSLTKISLLLCS